ncbi:MAG: MYXO-CTERM sorting domain-containing protein [Sandaracinaceae bacterium]
MGWARRRRGGSYRLIVGDCDADRQCPEPPSEGRGPTPRPATCERIERCQPTETNPTATPSTEPPAEHPPPIAEPAEIAEPAVQDPPEVAEPVTTAPPASRASTPARHVGGCTATGSHGGFPPSAWVLLGLLGLAFGVRRARVRHPQSTRSALRAPFGIRRGHSRIKNETEEHDRTNING